jgi:hypothetical protein
MFTSKEAKSGRGMVLLPGFRDTINMIIAVSSVAAKHLQIVSSSENVFVQEP